MLNIPESPLTIADKKEYDPCLPRTLQSHLRVPATSESNNSNLDLISSGSVQIPGCIEHYSQLSNQLLYAME
jgi:hypothetical protein